MSRAACLREYYQRTTARRLTLATSAYDPRAFHCDPQMCLPCDGVRP